MKEAETEVTCYHFAWPDLFCLRPAIVYSGNLTESKTCDFVCGVPEGSGCFLFEGAILAVLCSTPKRICRLRARHQKLKIILCQVNHFAHFSFDFAFRGLYLIRYSIQRERLGTKEATAVLTGPADKFLLLFRKKELHKSILNYSLKYFFLKRKNFTDTMLIQNFSLLLYHLFISFNINLLKKCFFFVSPNVVVYIPLVLQQLMLFLQFYFALKQFQFFGNLLSF